MDSHAHALEYVSGLVEWYWYIVIFLVGIVLVAVFEQRWRWNKVIIGVAIVAALTFLVTRNNSWQTYWDTAASINALAALTFLFVMFYIYEYGGHCVLHSGLAEWIATRWWMRRNFNKKLLWVTWVGSAVLDNVAMGKAAKKIAQEYYGSKEIPRDLSIGIIAASNAGGAWSPIGDTTTIMIALQVLLKLPFWWGILIVWLAFPASLLYQILLTLFLKEGTTERLPIDAEIAKPIPRVKKLELLPLLAIPGLVAGILSNFVLDERYQTLKEFAPTLGLLGGFILGIVIGKVSELFTQRPFRVHWGVFGETELAINTGFILQIVYAAHLLPIMLLAQKMASAPGFWLFSSQDVFIAGVTGTSPLLDNIPLVQCVILMGGFLWHRVALGAGVGGSMFWLGSSCGVNVTMPEHGQTHNPARELSTWLGRGGWTYKLLLITVIAFTFDVVLYNYFLADFTAWIITLQP